jgi:hypothetical protein
MNKMRFPIIVCLAMILLACCSIKHESLPFNSNFTVNDSEFKFLSAERYSSSTIKNGSLTYQDAIVVWMEWTCKATNDCDVSGANFSLTTSNPSGAYAHTPDIIIYYPGGFPIPNGSWSCCGRLSGGNKATVYLAWNENGCNSYDQYWVKYEEFLRGGEPIYYVQLPKSMECNH